MASSSTSDKNKFDAGPDVVVTGASRVDRRRVSLVQTTTIPDFDDWQCNDGVDKFKFDFVPVKVQGDGGDQIRLTGVVMRGCDVCDPVELNLYEDGKQPNRSGKEDDRPYNMLGVRVYVVMGDEGGAGVRLAAVAESKRYDLWTPELHDDSPRSWTDDEGTLKLRWEVDLEVYVYRTEEATLEQHKQLPPKEKDVYELLSSIRTARGNAALNDFRIKCVGEDADGDAAREPVVYSCSKFVLATKSDYFKAMFGHGDCREVQDGEVEVEGCSHVALDIFINLLYNIQDERLNKWAMEVYTLADRYQAPAATRTCLDSVWSNLSVSNAAGVLAFAELYGIADLEKRALKLAAKNVALAMETQAWKKLGESTKSRVLAKKEEERNSMFEISFHPETTIYEEHADFSDSSD